MKLPKHPFPNERPSPTVELAFFLFGVVLFVAHCIACVKQPERPACSQETLAELEAAYVAEAISTCRGKTRETCAELPAIEAKYKAQREEWIACH